MFLEIYFNGYFNVNMLNSNLMIVIDKYKFKFGISLFLVFVVFVSVMSVFELFGN